MDIEQVTAWKYNGEYYESELAAMQALTLNNIDSAIFSLKRAESHLANKIDVIKQRKAVFFGYQHRENLEEYLEAVKTDFHEALASMQELEELIEAQS